VLRAYPHTYGFGYAFSNSDCCNSYPHTYGFGYAFSNSDCCNSYTLTNPDPAAAEQVVLRKIDTLLFARLRRNRATD